MSDDDANGAALARADAVGRAAAAVGFDWPDVGGPLAKVREELGELEEAIAEGRAERMEAELGDLLFAVTNVARHLGVSSERALAGCLERFARRLSKVEASLAAEGRSMSAASLEELEARWQAAKLGEGSAGLEEGGYRS